ncbi:MAG: aspartate aminotransferase family protein [Candidatus Omnitrophica bacterium]|nr:aspartate aminotransferase family protein [Candidatus Omnitrophota bacterium]
MKKEEVFQNYDKYILSTYSRNPVVFVKGKGMTLVDIDGKKYLDFFPGWGVSNMGHCHPKVMAGVRDQIGKLIHVPNNFYHPNQAKLAKEIIRWSFPGKVFFCNSGAEGCEAAIKLARAYGKGERFEIITMKNSFHGRTLGALTATGQEKYQKGFAPLLEGFKTIAFNDINALKAAVTDKTIAIMFEPVQGEGGINIADKDYVKEIRTLCDQKNILLIFDEVQTGMGRTGEMFAFKHYGITPDLMVLAKALGGGLPIGALVVGEKFTDTLKPGMHASTFGGSPLICKASLGAFKAIVADKMLKNAKTMGEYLMKKLDGLKEKLPCISQVRGLGLMIGVELTMEGKAVFEECLKNGLVINCTQGNVLRLMPALTVTKKQADKAIYILEKSLKTVTGQ